ncbi:MAG TPA: AgmX/PglI C-terminal domain-containing protein [Polyangiales bacterium]|nr:AgmX/PglI C-terminal domain-containing protein [Polyangiales bacterium]
MAAHSALKTLGMGLWLALTSTSLQAQVLPTAPNVLSTRAPVVEWGTLPAKQVLTSKTISGEDPDRRDARVNVSGIKGTLNRDDVHQAMDARQRELNGCVQQTRRGAGWVSGALQFAFKVDAQGRVIQVRPLGSSIGHYALEQCIMQVLSETQFPPPSGRATAEFKWGMKVESGRGAGLKQERNRSVAASVRKHRKALWKQCEVPKRARYKVTAYVSSTGQVISAGAVTKPGPFEEKVPCLIEELSKLQLPKQKHMAKVEFDLR